LPPPPKRIKPFDGKRLPHAAAGGLLLIQVEEKDNGSRTLKSREVLGAGRIAKVVIYSIRHFASGGFGKRKRLSHRSVLDNSFLGSGLYAGRRGRTATTRRNRKHGTSAIKEISTAPKALLFPTVRSVYDFKHGGRHVRLKSPKRGTLEGLFPTWPVSSHSHIGWDVWGPTIRRKAGYHNIKVDLLKSRAGMFSRAADGITGAGRQFPLRHEGGGSRYTGGAPANGPPE